MSVDRGPFRYSVDFASKEHAWALYRQQWRVAVDRWLATRELPGTPRTPHPDERLA